MSERELYIVEGESAASTIRQAMHKPSQAVLPVKGKLINVLKASQSKVLANEICRHIVDVLECGWQEQCDPNHLAFSRVIILADPDVDGAHARALLINFFASYLEPLIAAGLVFVVMPPLYRLVSEDGNDKLYAWSKEQYEGLRRDHSNLTEATRFKGIAQFSLDECAELFLHAKCPHRARLCLNQDSLEGS